MSQSPLVSGSVEYYHRLMAPFYRRAPDLVVLVESPPNDGEFFYYQTGDMEEPLFNTLMELISFNPSMKVYGLEQLCDLGVIVLDATYHEIHKTAGQNLVIPGILDLYKGMLRNANGMPPAVIGTAAILDRIEALMRLDGEDVATPGVWVPYPNDQNRGEFLRLARSALGGRVLRWRLTWTR